MSVCGQADDVSTSEDLSMPPVREHSEPKTTRKAVRVLIVLAYLLSVSLSAILLSVYYIYMWQAPEVSAANSSDVVSGSDAHRSDNFMIYDDHDETHLFGRSNTSINDTSSTVANPTAHPINATLTTEANSAKTAEFSDDSDALFNNSYYDEAANNSTTVQDNVT